MGGEECGQPSSCAWDFAMPHTAFAEGQESSGDGAPGSSCSALHGTLWLSPPSREQPACPVLAAWAAACPSLVAPSLLVLQASWDTAEGTWLCHSLSWCWPGLCQFPQELEAGDFSDGELVQGHPACPAVVSHRQRVAFCVDGANSPCVLSAGLFHLHLLSAGSEKLRASNLRTTTIKTTCGNDTSSKIKPVGESSSLTCLLLVLSVA